MKPSTSLPGAKAGGRRRAVIDDSSIRPDFLGATAQQVRAHLGVATRDPKRPADAKTKREIEALLTAAEQAPTASS